ncbi:BLUF domain-containing protein [Pelagicoccus sp. NFK12]|uniref:BLUF domain-containing protein n=1 Tax=Pelagicoccus enzymogenes TaxID=2773457 RepID=A0A927IGJ7_9BACT|nr:BLUF domain-containing protein [Pelagicoccus enzymogenes]MBD5778455.1 BLUF domain-containing protein [Pelagicoccus enzymogenes]MDQ8197184.1 BLUF domain-containing protein [Pelagicoccus enzymogenes]
MSTCRLIYRSTAREETLTNDALARLQYTSISNNNSLGITGILVLSGDQFLQVLEGDSERVNELYHKIAQDPRHHKVRLISFESINERYFSDWGMRLIDLYDLPMQPRKFLMQKYQSVEDTICIPTQLNLVYALLLDAKLFCLSEPWDNSPVDV